jgi:hypothetical protein
VGFYLDWIYNLVRNNTASNNILVLTANTSSIIVYDLNTGQEKKSLNTNLQINSFILYNQYLIALTNTNRGDIKVWDLDSSYLTCTFNNTGITDLVLINEKYFASSDFTNKIWNYKTCTSINTNLTISVLGPINIKNNCSQF